MPNLLCSIFFSLKDFGRRNQQSEIMLHLLYSLCFLSNYLEETGTFFRVFQGQIIEI